MYDTDVGVGYGAKLFLLNHLKRGESLDTVVFNSTKGQRWARVQFSAPDFERRQGEAHPLSLDIYADYDARIRASFFGVGSDAEKVDQETYRREALDLRATIGRGISPPLVGQVGVRYRSVGHSEFEEDGSLRSLPPVLNSGRAAWVSVYAIARHDTRNSFVNPTEGVVLTGEAELAPGALANAPGLMRVAGWSRLYLPVLGGRLTLAGRAGMEGVAGDDLPVQALLPVGGGGTVRGLSQDRYLDRLRALVNVEARFPLYRRLGGIVGVDAGSVWASVEDASLRGWHTSPAVGLRYYLDTFVARLDVGLGRETTGVYFNFGQVF